MVFRIRFLWRLEGFQWAGAQEPRELGAAP